MVPELFVHESGKFTACNQEWTYYALDMADQAELVRRWGAKWFSEKFKDFCVEEMLTVLWLGLRRAGLTREQVRAKKWAIEEDEVGRLFNSGEGKKLVDIVINLLEISGIVSRKSGSDRPTKMETTTPEPAALPIGMP